jgi:hypothetical protein
MWRATLVWSVGRRVVTGRASRAAGCCMLQRSPRRRLEGPAARAWRRDDRKRANDHRVEQDTPGRRERQRACASATGEQRRP